MSMSQVDLPTLMASSKVFGRGLGAKKFTKVFEAYPDFAGKRHNYEEYHSMLLKVDGFADKTASLAAKGMVDFWEFVDTQLSSDIYARILKNTINVNANANLNLNANTNDQKSEQKFTGKNIYLTGVRSQEIERLIVSEGGTIQSTFNGSTHMLIRKNADYTNKKTEEAEQRGIPILTVEEFMRNQDH